MQVLTTTGFKGMVNAAFLQDVKDSNPDLWDLMAGLRQLPISGVERGELAKRYVFQLSVLKKSLALQFTLEETYGFIGGIAGPNEIASCDALTARQQHRELYLHFQEICERADESQYRGTITRDLDLLVADFDSFDSEMEAHEANEADLISSNLPINPRAS